MRVNFLTKKAGDVPALPSFEYLLSSVKPTMERTVQIRGKGLAR